LLRQRPAPTKDRVRPVVRDGHPGDHPDDGFPDVAIQPPNAQRRDGDERKPVLVVDLGGDRAQAGPPWQVGDEHADVPILVRHQLPDGIGKIGDAQLFVAVERRG
jgi:hypothetical protein